MNKTKLRIFTLVLGTLMILLVATNPGILTVKAQTQDSVYVYTSVGGTVSANGTSLTGGNSYNYADGASVNFTATSNTGFQFLCWEYAASSGTNTSTDNPFVYTISSAECAIQAMFVPSVNTTLSSSSSQTGTAPFEVPMSIGGTTTPAAGTYDNYTIGTVVNFTATAGNGFKFLYWLVPTASGDAVNIVTSNTLAFNVTDNACAVQAFFIPTSSTVTLPTITTINEFSTAATIIVALALVAVAFGTYAYKRRTKK